MGRGDAIESTIHQNPSGGKGSDVIGAPEPRGFL